MNLSEFRLLVWITGVVIVALVMAFFFKAFKMTYFERSPYLWILALAMGIGLITALGGIFIKKSADDIAKERAASIHLDDYSLRFFSTMTGLMFAIDEPRIVDFAKKKLQDDDEIFKITPQKLQMLGCARVEYLAKIEALRHLIGLELIELDAFPSQNISWGYYLTALGRHLLTEKLRRKLYPPDFCEMIRVRYWERESKINELDRKEFERKKKKFKADFWISWDSAWREAFTPIIKDLEPDRASSDPLTIWESYSKKNKPYDLVMQELVNPWKKKIDVLKQKQLRFKLLKAAKKTWDILSRKINILFPT